MISFVGGIAVVGENSTNLVIRHELHATSITTKDTEQSQSSI